MAFGLWNDKKNEACNCSASLVNIYTFQSHTHTVILPTELFVRVMMMVMCSSCFHILFLI